MLCGWEGSGRLAESNDSLLMVLYHATACNATHGIAVAVLSVHPSVRCMYCDRTI